MKILSASVKVIDDKNSVSFLTLADVDITIKADNPIKDIPKIVEQEIPKTKTKTKKTKKPKK